MYMAPAAKTWVLLNYPYAFAQCIDAAHGRGGKIRRPWRIIVSDPKNTHSTVISGPARHATEYKAWKAAIIHMNKDRYNIIYVKQEPRAVRRAKEKANHEIL